MIRQIARILKNRLTPQPAGEADIVRAPADEIVFDQPHALRLNEARIDHFNSLVLPIENRSVVDIGSGVGHFASLFSTRNCRLHCIDGRGDNIRILRERFPGIEASVVDVEDPGWARIGHYDIVFCYGLLYHLSDPRGFIKTACEICDELLIIETCITDAVDPVLILVPEPASAADQSFRGVGSRPSPSYVAFCLHSGGMPFIYTPKAMPRHPDFEYTPRNDKTCNRDGHLMRRILIGSRKALDNPRLQLFDLSGLVKSARRVESNRAEAF